MLQARAFVAFSLLVTTLALPACGGKSFDAGARDSSDGGGSGVAGGGSAGVAGGGSAGVAGGGSAGAAGGDNGQGGTAQCDAYRDDGPANISVRIVNETQAPLYLGPQPGCGAEPFFIVTDAAGSLLQPYSFCQTTCQQLIAGRGIACLPIACPVGPVLMLQPGEDTLQLWNGLYIEAKTLTPECRPSSGESTCQRVASVKPGTFTFTASAGSQLDCSSAVCMTCMPSDTGGCTTYGGGVLGPVHSAKTELSLDASYGLGDPGGGGMVRSVEIVFRD